MTKTAEEALLSREPGQLKTGSRRFLTEPIPSEPKR